MANWEDLKIWTAISDDANGGKEMGQADFVTAHYFRLLVHGVACRHKLPQDCPWDSPHHLS